ncbi:Transcription factor 25-like protein [Diplonema papillatum]|nr:Transcription factor 25-like protein [Diplonema papillatum]KAJ9458606.1 Transcription factor 25-like protein [Diplonema papillatum]
MSRLPKKHPGRDIVAVPSEDEDDDVVDLAVLQPTGKNRKNEKKKQKRAAAASGGALPPPGDAPPESGDGSAPSSPPAAVAAEGPPANDRDGAKKKKKKQAKRAPAPGPSPAAAKEESAASSDSEDVEAILRAHEAALEEKRRAKEQGKKQPQAAAAAPDGSEHAHPLRAERLPRLLQASERYLNPAEELKKMFGTAAIAQERRDAQEQLQERGFGRNERRHPHHNGGAPVASQAHKLRPTVLIKPPASSLWPRFSNAGYAIERRDGELCVLKESPLARQASMHLAQAVNTMSAGPDAVFHLAAKFPYHIAILSTCSYITAQMGQPAESDELMEQALYAAASAVGDISRGTPSTSSDYAHAHREGFSFLGSFAQRRFPCIEANTEVYACVRHRVHALLRRGCSRTALEWSKMLVSLDARDPEFGFLLLDYCAVKAGQWEWFLDVCGELSAATDKYTSRLTERQKQDLICLADVPRLPNFRFSKALCLKLLEQNGRLPSGGGPTPDEALKQAILLYPTAVQPLLEKAKLVDAAAGGLSNKLASRPPSEPPATVAALVDRYTLRCGDLWTGRLGSWLVEVASRVLEEETEELRASNAERVAGWAEKPAFVIEAKCPVGMLMGTITVLPPEAFEDEDEPADHPEDHAPVDAAEFDAILRDVEAAWEDAFQPQPDAADQPSEALQMLAVAEEEAGNLSEQVDAFLRSEPGAAVGGGRAALDESLTAQLLFADSIVGEEYERELVRERRKAVIARIQNLCKALEDASSAAAHASSSPTP